MKSSVLTLRKPIPLARAIRWFPAGLFTPPRTLDDLALFITQSALRDVMRHLRSDPERELLGFLLGELYECPETGARYVVINSAFRTGYALAESDRILIPEEEWLGVQLEVRRRRTQLVGWYHSAPFVGPHPARADLETHVALFNEPWQCGLVIATTGDAPTGAFFRSLIGERTGGGVMVPFYELADEDEPIPASGRKRTLIDWVNYETRGIVERDESERRPFVASPPPTPRSSPVILSVPHAPEDDDEEGDDRIFSPPPAAEAPPPHFQAPPPVERPVQTSVQPPAQPAVQPPPAQPPVQRPAEEPFQPSFQAPPQATPQAAPQAPAQAPPQAPAQATPPVQPPPAQAQPPVQPPVEPPAAPRGAPPGQPVRQPPVRLSPGIIPLNPPTEDIPFEPAAPAAPAAHSNGGEWTGVANGGMGTGGGGQRTPPGSRPGVSPLAGRGLVMLPSAAELQEMLAEPELPIEESGGMRRGIRFLLAVATVAAVVVVYLWNSGRLQLPESVPGLSVLDRSAATSPSTKAGDNRADSQGDKQGGNQARGADGLPAETNPALLPPVAESAGASLSLSDSAETAPSESTSTSTGRQPMSPSTGAAPESAATSAPTSTDPAGQHFAALADTLEESIRNFHDRSDDFAVHRITCSGLAVGYRAADDAFIALASSHRSARDSLDPTQESRYRELVKQMGEVNEEFGKSGCPRP